MAKPQTEEDKVFAKILRRASVCEQSSEKLRRRLLREGHDESLVEDALAKAMDYGIIDDSRYAESYMRTKLASGHGRKGIERELSLLGISSPSDEAWHDVGRESEQDEYQAALSLLSRHPPRSKHPRESAYRKLMQRGYTGDVAARASREWYEQTQAPNDGCA